MFEEDVVQQIRAGHTAVERASHQNECGGRFVVLAENEDSDFDTVADNEAADACEETGGADVATRRKRLRITWRDNPPLIRRSAMLSRGCRIWP